MSTEEAIEAGVRPPRLDADPICHRFKKAKDKPTFVFQPYCMFTDTTGLPQSPSNVTLFDNKYPQFEYYAHGFATLPNTNETHLFAVSNYANVTDDFQLLLKVYNFEKLSDLSASQMVNFEPDQMMGRDRVSFTLDLVSIEDEFLAGGRLYFEVGVYSTITKNTPPGLYKRTHQRVFVDFSDYTVPSSRLERSVSTALKGWQILLIVVASLAALSALVYGIVRYKRYQEKLKKK
eukprot:CAMPEP_0201561236 /NCGR_PEP_ID=MMETSP0173_2-20130828/78689_1 /ASSEMBLY_ACC=CAM_ASM_000268 /TAXON_ID=218659 /ORGANISM="Vexillifera sp., Strain DIVA3 564/2" /LENGTH=233 /DNA_ID=CAMNT_0047975725 /DNA_START=632 /DNA_END=1333 /DNA_ORIENTATION=+